jgi:hypothetical protein
LFLYKLPDKALILKTEPGKNKRKKINNLVVTVLLLEKLQKDYYQYFQKKKDEGYCKFKISKK